MTNDKPAGTSCWDVVEIIEIGNEFSEHHVMTFRSGDYRMEFPVDSIVTERRGNDIYSTLYTFDKARMTLQFDRSEGWPPSPITGRRQTKYRVVPTGEDEFYLLGPDDADNMGKPFDMTVLLHRV